MSGTKSFDEWRDEFEQILIQCGMPEPQARKYDHEYSTDALHYYERAFSPADAATKELMG